MFCEFMGILFFLTETLIIIYVWICELQSSTAHPVGRRRCWPACTDSTTPLGGGNAPFSSPSVAECGEEDGRRQTVYTAVHATVQPLSQPGFVSLFFFIIPPTPATTRRTTDIRVLKWSAGEDFSVFGNPNFQHEPWVKAAGVLFFWGAAAEDETTGAANMIWVPVVFM